MLKIDKINPLKALKIRRFLPGKNSRLQLGNCPNFHHDSITTTPSPGHAEVTKDTDDAHPPQGTRQAKRAHDASGEASLKKTPRSSLGEFSEKVYGGGAK